VVHKQHEALKNGPPMIGAWTLSPSVSAGPDAGITTIDVDFPPSNVIALTTLSDTIRGTLHACGIAGYRTRAPDGTEGGQSFGVLEWPNFVQVRDVTRVTFVIAVVDGSARSVGQVQFW
jgi:hypothetical protein